MRTHIQSVSGVFFEVKSAGAWSKLLSTTEQFSFTKYRFTARGRTAWITSKIHNFTGNQQTIALPFIFHIPHICSCVHRDTEEIPDSSVPGKEVSLRLRTACPYWNWNNNTSSRYRGLYPGIRYPLWCNVLPRTGEVRPRPFHRGKQTQSTELHIYSIWRGPENVPG